MFVYEKGHLLVLIIFTLMIVELIEHKGHLLALNDQAQLLLWNITSQSLLNFPHSVSLLPTVSTHTYDKSLLGLTKINHQAFLYNSHSILSLDLNILPALKPEEVKLGECLKGQQIKCMIAVTDGQILVASDRGNLFLFDLSEGTLIKKVSLWEQVKGEKQEGRLSTGFERMATITCLVLERGVVFVGADNGKIYCIDLGQLRFIFEVTGKHVGTLQPISKLKIRPQQDKIYSIHRNYILQWNYKLSTCLNYIECASPQGIAGGKDGLIVAGLSSSFWLKDQQHWELELSMRGVGTLLELGTGTVAVGGSDNLVDVFTDSTRLMTLVPK